MMRQISYTLSCTSSRSSNGFYIVGKNVSQCTLLNFPQLPSDIAGINLEGRKYSNYDPPSHSGISQKISMVFQSVGLYVRERFSRYYKPVDHLGGVSPEKRIPFYEPLTINDINRDMEIWPKVGTTFENMDILVD